ncbi:MAG: hypothetical protein AB1714_22075 [Acidobacteriota bacterium]
MCRPADSLCFFRDFARKKRLTPFAACPVSVGVDVAVSVGVGVVGDGHGFDHDDGDVNGNEFFVASYLTTCW